MRLAELQQQFIKDLTTGSQGSVPMLAGSSAQAKSRLKVYQNSVGAIISDVLADFFPVVQQLVGEAYFNQLVRQYIALSPPQQGNMDAYGATFADFLAESGQPLEYLPDIARLEWLQHAALIAADEPQLTAQAFQNHTEFYLTHPLQLASCAVVLSSAYPVLTIWQMHNQNKVRELNSLNQAEIALICREPEGTVGVWPLQPWQQDVLTLSAQQNLPWSMEQLHTAPQEMQQFIAFCLQRGLWRDNK